MFPLSTVLLPHAALALHVFEDRYRALVADCLAADSQFGVVLITRGSEVWGGDERVRIGTLARIVVAQPLADGRWALLARGSRRIKVNSWLEELSYPRAIVQELTEPVGSPPAASLDEARISVARARALLSELGEDTGSAASVPRGGDGRDDAERSRTGGDSTQSADSVECEDDDSQVWQLCAQAPLTVADRQRLLEAADHAARLELLCRLCAELSDEIAGYLGGA